MSKDVETQGFMRLVSRPGILVRFEDFGAMERREDAAIKDCPENDASLAARTLGGQRWADRVTTRVKLRFGFMDRFRILLHGKAFLHVRTETEFIVGRANSDSQVTVPRLWQMGGLELIASEVDAYVQRVQAP